MPNFTELFTSIGLREDPHNTKAPQGKDFFSSAIAYFAVLVARIIPKELSERANKDEKN